MMDYNIEVEYMNIYSICQDFKFNFFMSLEIFDDIQTKFEQFCDTLQIMSEVEETSYINQAGEPGMCATICFFLTMLKQKNVLEELKMNFMYSEEVNVDETYLKLWTSCSKIRNLVQEFDQIPDESIGREKIKQMFRKLKLVLVSETNEGFKLNDNEVNNQIDFGDHLVSKISDVKTIIKENAIYSKKKLQMIDLEDAVYLFLDTQFNVEVLFGFLAKKQQFLETLNYRLEILYKMAINVNKSILAPSIYETYGKLLGQTSRNLTKLTKSYSGIASFFVQLQYQSL